MKRAAKLLIFSMLGSGLSGCAPLAAPLPERIRPEECPRPAPLCADDLPALDGGLPFDAPENVDALLRRHNLVRAHVREQDAALDCYQRQVGRMEAWKR